MSITIVAKKPEKTLDGNVIVIDILTDIHFAKFSPFYSHYSIPLSPGVFASSIEEAWESAKVFENEGVHTVSFRRKECKKRGKLLGFQNPGKDELVIASEAWKQLYVPLYHYTLDNILTNEVNLLVGLVQEGNELLLVERRAHGHSLSRIIRNHVLKKLNPPHQSSRHLLFADTYSE